MGIFRADPFASVTLTLGFYLGALSYFVLAVGMVLFGADALRRRALGWASPLPLAIGLLVMPTLLFGVGGLSTGTRTWDLIYAASRVPLGLCWVLLGSADATRRATVAEARRGLLADPRWERWSAASGLIFVALFVVWLKLYGALEPAGGQPRPSDAEILSDVVAGDRRLHLAHFVVGLTAIFFLWFLGSLRATLQRAEGAPASLSAGAFAAGVVIAILMLLAGAPLPGLADVLRRGGTLEPRVAGAFYDVVGAIFSLVPFAVVVLVGATSLVALRSRALPAWLGWAGGVLVLFLLAGAASIDLTGEDPLWFVGILGMLLWLAWLVAVSLVLLLAGRGDNQTGQSVLRA